MNRLRVVVALPNDNAYQHEQAVVAKSTAKQLGLDLQVLQANNDPITQSQQLLQIIQSAPEGRPSAFLVEPVTAAGLHRVAQAAVAAGIAWVVSNSEVDYAKELRQKARVPVFIVSQGQPEVGRLQAKQLAALLPRGGSVLLFAGPSMSSVASQRREAMESVMPKNVQLTTLRNQWSEEAAFQSASAWLRLATSRAEKFDLVAGQSHELAMGARRALQEVENPQQRNRWLEVPFIGTGVSSQVKPLVDRRLLTAAVVTSVTMDLALRLLVRALETQVQPPERNTVEVSSYPELDKLNPDAIKP